jgi:hypothetical protein
MQAYKSLFKDIGIDMDIKAMDIAQEFPYVQSGKHDQMAGGGGGGGTFPPTRNVDTFYSKSPAIGTTGTNDPVYDTAYDKFWAANTPAEAAAACVECDKRVVEQHWGVWMVQGSTFSFYQPYLKGFSNERITGWGAGVVNSRLWIDQSLKK